MASGTQFLPPLGLVKCLTDILNDAAFIIFTANITLFLFQFKVLAKLIINAATHNSLTL